MREMQAQCAYTEEELAAITRAMEARFGRVNRVIQDFAPHGTRVELCVMATEGAAYQVVATRGMGARAMRAPAGAPNRAELACYLPREWDLESCAERWYWPLRWLKLLARVPEDEDSWLGWGHTIAAGAPLAENTALCALLLLDCDAVDPIENSRVRFYRMVPLFEEELEFVLAQGAQAFLEQFGARLPLAVQPTRPNCCATAPTPKESTPTPFDWEGADGCMVTQRVLAEDCPVGYCYREAPCGEWDSGWRFAAGDESEAYMADQRNCPAETLGHIALCDPQIVPILRTPAPCTFARGEDGLQPLKSILF
ncbi:MAG: DUF2185 domain-containing protein [Oscillospiraceae bacterium]|nr:DUF2185 domain-containing protein [Oscillospiraceae bacterium]